MMTNAIIYNSRFISETEPQRHFRYSSETPTVYQNHIWWIMKDKKHSRIYSNKKSARMQYFMHTMFKITQLLLNAIYQMSDLPPSYYLHKDSRLSLKGDPRSYLRCLTCRYLISYRNWRYGWHRVSL
jgi:hypothetical protein